MALELDLHLQTFEMLLKTFLEQQGWIWLNFSGLYLAAEVNPTIVWSKWNFKAMPHQSKLKQNLDSAFS